MVVSSLAPAEGVVWEATVDGLISSGCITEDQPVYQVPPSTVPTVVVNPGPFSPHPMRF